MPSDLQRVARGLVECLDESPQVVAHLQRTAARCRENAGIVIAVSHGRATVAAQQLDAAARSCEEAAHYLAMAPLKARGWAERLVGSGRSSNRTAPGSADRNKATRVLGDIADRDELGRVTRTAEPLDPRLAKETPLVKVARVVLRTARRPAAEQREDDEPLEAEIVVDRRGAAKLLERWKKQEKEDRKDQEEAQQAADRVADLAEGNAAAAELLKAMADGDQGNWHKAVLTIERDQVVANFEYDDSERRPVEELELVELAGVDLGDRPTPSPGEEPEPIESPEFDVELPELTEQAPSATNPIESPEFDVESPDFEEQEPTATRPIESAEFDVELPEVEQQEPADAAAQRRTSRA